MKTVKVIELNNEKYVSFEDYSNIAYEVWKLEKRISNLERIRELDNEDLDGILDDHDKVIDKVRRALAILKDIENLIKT